LDRGDTSGERGSLRAVAVKKKEGLQGKKTQPSTIVMRKTKTLAGRPLKRVEKVGGPAPEDRKT